MTPATMTFPGCESYRVTVDASPAGPFRVPAGVTLARLTREQARGLPPPRPLRRPAPRRAA